MEESEKFLQALSEATAFLNELSRKIDAINRSFAEALPDMVALARNLNLVLDEFCRVNARVDFGVADWLDLPDQTDMIVAQLPHQRQLLN